MTGAAAATATAAAAAKAAAAKVRAGAASRDSMEASSSASSTEQLLQQQQQMSKIAGFHQELTETCVDILARYMFANPSVQPRRLPTTNFLLKEGNSATWLLNTMLITVTTSLCDQNATRGGLCERCHLICSKAAAKADQESFQQSDLDSRRRHQSEFQAHRPGPSRYMPGASAKEDFDLRRQLSAEKLGSEETGSATEASAKEGHNSKGIPAKLESVLQGQKESDSQKSTALCACWCTGWAEILVRRPAGNASWMCRIQNSSLVSSSHSDLPLTADLSALFQPSKDREFRGRVDSALDMSKRIQVETLSDAQYSELVTAEGQESFSIMDKLPSLNPGGGDGVVGPPPATEQVVLGNPPVVLRSPKSPDVQKAANEEAKVPGMCSIIVTKLLANLYLFLNLQLPRRTPVEVGTGTRAAVPLWSRPSLRSNSPNLPSPSPKRHRRRLRTSEEARGFAAELAFRCPPVAP